MITNEEQKSPLAHVAAAKKALAALPPPLPLTMVDIFRTDLMHLCAMTIDDEAHQAHAAACIRDYARVAMVNIQRGERGGFEAARTAFFQRLEGTSVS